MLRIAAGLSQDVLGLRLGISSTYLGRIERGLRPMPEKLVEPWAGAIGVHADVLRAELPRGSVATTDSNESTDTSRVVSVK
ncbi:MAG: helix-turn-helix transcriptional regulator [bacterium]|nr:helix-turn-helix transcriptional regulator [bacterium]